jgi:hypothetical protein
MILPTNARTNLFLCAINENYLLLFLDPRNHFLKRYQFSARRTLSLIVLSEEGVSRQIQIICKLGLNQTMQIKDRYDYGDMPEPIFIKNSMSLQSTTWDSKGNRG